MHVIVLGGGIAGLGAAWAAPGEVEVTIVESNPDVVALSQLPVERPVADPGCGRLHQQRDQPDRAGQRLDIYHPTRSWT
jgi:tRNA U34 5-carboxymethylaminomethyl modifying enzyme MnmG/GidA